jgi:Skp family chaperone for outer membrane proteins
MTLATTRCRRGGPTPTRPLVLGPLILLLLILLSSVPSARAADEAAKDETKAASAEQLAKEIQQLQALLQRLTEEQKKEIEELQKRIAQLEKKLREAEAKRKKGELEQILAEADAATAKEAEKEKEAESQRDVFVGRQRNLQAMNPEISFLGDVSYGWTDSDVRDEFLLRGAELSFQAPLDPYTRFKGFLAGHQEAAELGHEHDPGDPGDDGDGHAHEGEITVSVEEAYMEWVALPANMRLRVGKFRQQFGTINRWHPHALSSVDAPLALRNAFGHEGLVGLGVGIDWALPGFWATSNGLTLEVVNADNETAFAGSGFRDPTYLLRHTGFFDLGPDTYFELGLNGVTGPNNHEGDRHTTVASVDISFVWEPVQRAKYRSVELRGEFIHTHRESLDERENEEYTFKSASFYTYVSWKLSRRWIVGLRYDDAELPSPEIELLHGQEVIEGLRERAWSPFLTFWQSEFVRLRLQYQHASRDFAWANGPENDNRVWIQVTFAAGPHKHEAY